MRGLNIVLPLWTHTSSNWYSYVVSTKCINKKTSPCSRIARDSVSKLDPNTTRPQSRCRVQFPPDSAAETQFLQPQLFGVWKMIAPSSIRDSERCYPMSFHVIPCHSLSFHIWIFGSIFDTLMICTGQFLGTAPLRNSSHRGWARHGGPGDTRQSGLLRRNRWNIMEPPRRTSTEKLTRQIWTFLFSSQILFWVSVQKSNSATWKHSKNIIKPQQQPPVFWT